MIRRMAPLALLTFATIAIEAPTIQAKAPMEPVEVKTVQSAAFAAGATVQIAGTAGELNIETWDQPRVEATLTRSEYADPGDHASLKKKLESIELVVEKRGNDVAVEMKTPKRHFWGRWLRGKTDATVVCRVMVPRDAKLVVRHDNGSVFVYGTANDIDATARFGDIVLQLVDPGQYAIDAQVKVGDVYTDYGGKYRQRVLVGQKFASEASASNAAGAHKVRLHVDIGGIDIVKMGPVPQSGF